MSSNIFSTPNSKKSKVSYPELFNKEIDIPQSVMEMSNVTSPATTLFACQENEVIIDNDIGGASVVYKFVDPPSTCKSIWWKFYKIYASKHKSKSKMAVCRNCGQEVNYKNGLSGLKRHAAIHKKSDESVKEQLDDIRIKKRNNLNLYLNATSSIKSPQIKRQEVLDSMVAWIVEENLPLGLTAKKSFRRMINTCNPKAPKFSREVIKNEVDSLGLICRKAVAKELKHTYFSVTTDHWTSIANETYSCLTAHYIKDGKMLRCALEFEVFHGSTKGELLGKDFINKFDLYEFDLKYVVAVVTDTTGNMNTFGKYLNDKGVVHLYCVNHNLHRTALLAFDDKNLPGSEQAMKAARSLIELFSKSTQAMDKLMKIQEALGIHPAKRIIQDVVTRWWSTWSMLNRLNELERPIQSLFAANDIDPNKQLLESQKVVLKEIEIMLHPMAFVQRYLEGDTYSTASLVPYLLYKVRESLKDMSISENISPTTCYLAKILLKDFEEKRYGDGTKLFHDVDVVIGGMNRYISLHRSVLVASLLDPRTKKGDPFIPSDDLPKLHDHIKAIMLETMNNIDHEVRDSIEEVEVVTNEHHDEPVMNVPVTNNNIECSFFTDLNNDSFVFDTNDPQEANKEACCAEFNRYMNLPRLYIKNDPLKWWEDNKVKLPTLYILAMQYLCIPATSAPSERLWSIASKILTKERNRLDSETVASLVFLKENGHILEQYIKEIDGRDRVLPGIFIE